MQRTLSASFGTTSDEDNSTVIAFEGNNQSALISSTSSATRSGSWLRLMEDSTPRDENMMSNGLFGLNRRAFESSGSGMMK